MILFAAIILFSTKLLIVSVFVLAAVISVALLLHFLKNGGDDGGCAA
jgi:hypothetical protein